MDPNILIKSITQISELLMKILFVIVIITIKIIVYVFYIVIGIMCFSAIVNIVLYLHQLIILPFGYDVFHISFRSIIAPIYPGCCRTIIECSAAPDNICSQIMHCL